MENGIDMRGYKVYYNNLVFDAVYCIPDLGYKMQRVNINLSTFFTVVVFNEQQCLISLYDQSKRFHFVKI